MRIRIWDFLNWLFSWMPDEKNIDAYWEKNACPQHRLEHDKTGEW